MNTKVLFVGIMLLGIAILPMQAGATTIVEDTISFIDDNNPMGKLIEGGIASNYTETFTFTFWHPEGYPDVTIDPEGLVSASLSITIKDISDPYAQAQEIVFVYTEGGNGAFEVAPGSNPSLFLDVGIGPILDTGGLEVTVVAVLGDICLQSSTATFVYDTGQGAPVPEPGTMLLLGTGLIGMAVAMKRKRPSMQGV